MNTNSLRFRLMALAIAATSLIVGITGIAFYLLFQRHVEGFLAVELDRHFQQLLSKVEISEQGNIVIRSRLSDPRFSQPNGGLYWQIMVDGQPPIRSRSLWDETLSIQNPPDVNSPNKSETIKGPLGAEIFAMEHLVEIPVPGTAGKPVLFIVAEDRSRVSNAISSFASSTTRGLGLVYVALLAGSSLMIALGLRPLAALRKGVEQVRIGALQRLSEIVPQEVAPLVQEVNGLVEARETQLERARQRASNLAHGLKTPLAVMVSIADELNSDGNRKVAGDIKQAVGQMHGLVERELAKSRMTDGSASYRSNLAQTAHRVVETIRRAPRGDELLWRVDIANDIEVGMDATDLTEMLGCLIDNARKHAASLVRVAYDNETLVVEDDGLGVDDDKLSTILQRGVRLDSTKPGSGLGLSIVSDLADVYKFDLSVTRGVLGGLQVTAAIPSKPDTAAQG
jgi:signal transduction histidine kinase